MRIERLSALGANKKGSGLPRVAIICAMFILGMAGKVILLSKNFEEDLPGA
jgi:hypothetical protein